MEAQLYDELHRVEQIHWWFRARRHIVWSLVRRYVDGGADRRLRICELGCGTGGTLTAIADDHDVVGVECSPEALKYARQSLGDRVHIGSLPHEIDLPAGSFDVVLMTDVLEHIEDDSAAAITAVSLVRPGGIVVATVPAYQWLYSPRDAHHHHFRRYGKRQFARLWSGAGAQTILLSHYNTLLFPPAAVVRMARKTMMRQPGCGDLSLPASPINNLLARIMGSEANLLGRVPIPFGLSLISVVRKTDASVTKNGRAAA
jgi:2-polyprenyl-3-methyl-5-hydroxy-6-metoxy-1,4-benzoquinol methylase